MSQFWDKGITDARTDSAEYKGSSDRAGGQKSSKTNYHLQSYHVKVIKVTIKLKRWLSIILKNKNFLNSKVRSALL